MTAVFILLALIGYSSDNRDGKQLSEDNLQDAGFIDKQLKIIVHGYQNDRTSLMITSLVNAYLDYGEYNIVAIDWGHFVKAGCYLQGVYSINPVGSCLAGFLKKVMDLKNYGGVHMLGHSLGAHISGRTSAMLKRDHGIEFNRLTRFNPAYPLFFDADQNKGVAAFRDTYHSNIGILGQSATEADVDVFINNGQFQPGCKCDERPVLRGEHQIRDVGIYCSAWGKLEDGLCDKHGEGGLRLIGDRADTNEKAIFITFGRDTAPYLIPEADYKYDDTFNNFDVIGDGECSEDVMKTLENFLKGT